MDKQKYVIILHVIKKNVKEEICRPLCRFLQPQIMSRPGNKKGNCRDTKTFPPFHVYHESLIT